ncbi:UNVERIFIED_CONTAM: hypothetical protein Sradi_6438400 [Sesamum radiatum]|uniref:CCHC-type domain-containing protein n=1 Tax=Sesamum radiatum TaxID=300843 RepID=A0AAW2K6A2_SESRA
MVNQEFVKLNFFDGTNYPRWKDKMMFLLNFFEDCVCIGLNWRGIKMVNQEFVKLNCFDGTNYPRWKDKMMFLLTFLKIAYVMGVNYPATEPQEGDGDQIRAARAKRGEDELLSRGHILNGLSDRLFDLYSSIKSPLEIWNALEQKYNTEKQGTNKFLTMKYFEFAMRAEETRIRDKMHQVQLSSKVNYVSEKNKNINPNGVGKKRKSFDSDSNKRHVTCYNCGKKGHIKKDCHFRKKQKTFEMPNVQVVETNVEEVIAMVFKLAHWYGHELNMAAAVKSFDWWYDSGATVHICNDKNQFKHYEDVAEGPQVLMGNANTTTVLGKGNVEVQFTSERSCC